MALKSYVDQKNVEHGSVADVSSFTLYCHMVQLFIDVEEAVLHAARSLFMHLENILHVKQTVEDS